MPPSHVLMPTPHHEMQLTPRRVGAQTFRLGHEASVSSTGKC